MIELSSLTKTFEERTAVDQISFKVAEGEIFGLVGPDGAGKTTLIRMLTSIMDPTSGTARVGGYDIVRDSEQVKEQIGYMSQRFGLYPDLTVEENIQFYADIFGVGHQARQTRLSELLAFSQLTPFKKRLAKDLSGGMKQKLGLVCALIHTPRILFLDEPTNGVDPVSRRDFWQILYRLLKEKVTIFLSTAYLDEAERCHRIGFLHEGRLLTLGTLDQIKERVPEQVIQIIVDQPRKALAILSQQEGFLVNLFGNRLHLLTKEAERTQALGRRLLLGGGVTIESMEIVPLTLEDAFISFLDRQTKENDS